MIASDRERGRLYEFIIENPDALLKYRPYSQIENWPVPVEVQFDIIDYCAFGGQHKKTTDLWHSLLGYHWTGLTGSGRCQQRCPDGKYVTDKYGRTRWVHPKALGWHSDMAPHGHDRHQQTCAVPRQVGAEFLAEVQRRQGGRDVVIDLFAGYESLAEECTQRGLTYVAVDIVMRGQALKMSGQKEEGDVGT